MTTLDITNPVTLESIEDHPMVFIPYLMERFEARWKEQLLNSSHFNGKTFEIDPEVMIPIGLFYDVFTDCKQDLKNKGIELKAVKIKKSSKRKKPGK